MAENAMSLLLEQANDQERRAQLALVSARQDLANYHVQLEQIEHYRLEYCKQLSSRGQQGLTSSSFSHLNKFIVQLDETLVQQRQAGQEFERNVESCREHWQICRQKKRSIEWLLEKRQKEENQRLERQEQKLNDEFATLSFVRRRSN